MISSQSSLNDEKSDFRIEQGSEDPRTAQVIFTRDNEIFSFDEKYQFTKYKLQPKLEQVWTRRIQRMNPVAQLANVEIFSLPGGKVILQYNYFIMPGETWEPQKPEARYTAVIDNSLHMRLDAKKKVPVSTTPYLDAPISKYVPISKTRFACGFRPNNRLKHNRWYIYDVTVNPKKPVSEINARLGLAVFDERTLILYDGEEKLWIYREDTTKPCHYKPVTSAPIVLSLYNKQLPGKYYFRSDIVTLPELKRGYILEQIQFREGFVGINRLIQVKLMLFELVGNKVIKRCETLLTDPSFFEREAHFASLKGAYINSLGLARVVIETPRAISQSISPLRIYDGDTLSSYEELLFPVTLRMKGTGYYSITIPTPVSIDPSGYRALISHVFHAVPGQLKIPHTSLPPHTRLFHISNMGHLIFANDNRPERQGPLTIVSYNYKNEFEIFSKLVQEGITFGRPDLRWGMPLSATIAQYCLDTLHPSLLAKYDDEFPANKQLKVSSESIDEQYLAKESEQQVEEIVSIKISVKVKQVQVQPPQSRESISYNDFSRIVNEYKSKSFLANRFFCCCFSPIRSGAMRELHRLLDDERKPDITKEQIRRAINADKYGKRRLCLFGDGRNPNNTGTDLVIQRLHLEFKKPL